MAVKLASVSDKVIAVDHGIFVAPIVNEMGYPSDKVFVRCREKYLNSYVGYLPYVASVDDFPGIACDFAAQLRMHEILPAN